MRLTAIALLVLAFAAAGAIAVAPQLTRQLGSGPTVKGPGHAEAAAIVLIGVVLMCAVLAMAASLFASLAARRAGMGSGYLWSCWLPTPVMCFATWVLWQRLRAG